MLHEHVRFEDMNGLEHNPAMLNKTGNDWYAIAVAKKRIVDCIVAMDNGFREAVKSEPGCGGMQCSTIQEFVRMLRRRA